MESTTNTNIKIIRLHGGEDIIADYIEEDDGETVLLNNPMQVVFKRIPTGQVVMMMMPWLPIEIIKDNHAILYTSDILTIVEPKEEAIKHYGEVVLESQERMANSFTQEDGDEDDEDDDDFKIEEETIEEMLDLIKTRDKKKLH